MAGFDVAIRSAKEFARHLMHRAGMRRSYSHLASPDRAGRFERIYADGVWRHGDASIPPSGHGSSLAATGTLRARLPAVLDELGVTILLDVGCGDFTWMAATAIRQEYIGVDIVSSVIATNRETHAGPGRRFEVCDGVVGPLPAADAVLCREVLFHLDFADALQLLRNILVTRPRYLLLTSDGGTLFNSDIVSGDFRSLNLRRAPFRLPVPTITILDDSVATGRIVGVWTADAVARALDG